MPGPVLLRSAPHAPTPLELGEAQRSVVDWRGPGMCVVLGAPGTGATTAIVESVVARASDVSATRMLVLARDRDAVTRMRSALARRMPAGALPTVTTFHGLAYSLVQRTMGPGPDSAMPRLLSGAEEDARIRDLLQGAIADGDLPWPGDLLAATATLGFANDVRAMLVRARELGIDPEELTSLGRAAGVPAWEVLGRLARIDSEVMALEGVVDYSRLLEMAIDAASAWRGELACIWVDDFQEAGPLQRGLLRALSGPGTATVVAADPDVAAYGFRGGDRLGALRLQGEAGASLIVLDRYFASGGQIRAAYAAVRRQPALPGLPAAALRAYREPAPAPSAADGAVTVLTHDTWGDLVAWTVDDLRRLHLISGASWDDMAVIARSTSELDALRRALSAAGVPVAMASTDIPLQDEPAVATLLAAVSAATAPDDVDERAAVDLITGPLLALDPSALRRLARALREEFRARHPGQPCPSGTALIRDLLVSAVAGDSAAPDVADVAIEPRDRVLALGGMLGSVRTLAERDAAPAEVLWQAWSSSVPDAEGWAWPERLRRAALSGHLASSHDLDAVLALFATAERLSDRYAGVVGVRGLLAALHGQRVAAERVSAAAPIGPAVTVMTAHLAVGRSWPHVVVVGAQEGSWPPPLGASSAMRLPEWEAVVAGDATGDVAVALRAAAAERMAQERRLFALAVSRASRDLTVAAVASDAEQPSRFIEDLGIAPVHRAGRPPRGLTLDGMVARLRTVAQDDGQPAPLREAAVARLAVLADARDDDGAPLVPRADPATWWGVAAATPGVAPVRPEDRPVRLSGSGLETITGCPLRWFLSRVVRAEGPRGQAMAIGSLVHAMAELAARGDIPVDPEVMLGHVDRVWSELPFDAPWESLAERAEVARALELLCGYLRTADPAIAIEHPFSVTFPIGTGEVTLRGAIDRVELDAEGSVRLIDFKTMRHLPSAREVAENLQLGVYQLAVEHGALADPAPPSDGTEPAIAGAALVQLREEDKRVAGLPRVQQQPPLDDDASWLRDAVAHAIQRVRTEEFPAIVSAQCRTCAFVAACPAQAAGREVLP